MKIGVAKMDISTQARETTSQPLKSTALSSNQTTQVASKSSIAAFVRVSSSNRSESASASVQVPTVQAGRSATMGGKSYPESIAESAGVYVASVPNPPGATAIGATIESAERNLQMKLDTLA